MNKRVEIKRLASGVEGLDEVLGGGVPEFSFNLIAGGPGCGKTTLGHQIMFSNATPETPALYITILGEPPLKMLRYQQQFSFFDEAKIGHGVRFLHLGAEAIAGGLEKVLEMIVEQVEATSPSLVMVDSFRAVTEQKAMRGDMDLRHFVQRLALHLTSWQATTFLIGEYLEHEADDNPILTVADGVLWLRQSVERNSVVRRAQVMKIRGQKQIPGLHTYRISDEGLRIYPRILNEPSSALRDTSERRGTGVAGLDEMMGGGIPAGFTAMVVGPSGSGKSILATHFILEGIERGEPGVIAVFEKRPDEYLQTLPNGRILSELVRHGKLRMMYLRPLDLSVEEAMEELRSLVREIGAKRIAIDSLSGFELALAPAYREEFRESLYRMLGALTVLGVTVLMTAELVESFTELRLSPHGISFLADALVLQRYVEAKGRMGRGMAVIKMCGCAHSDELRSYTISQDGISMGDALGDYGQVLTGVPLLGTGPQRGAVSKAQRPKAQRPKAQRPKAQRSKARAKKR